MRYIFLFLTALTLLQADGVYTQIKNELAKMESGNNQYAINSRGFLGKYQLGAMSLIEAGFIKESNYRALTYTVKTATRAAKVMWRDGYDLKKFLAQSENWNIAGGQEAFLESEPLQDKAMDTILQKNEYRLAKAGIDLSNPQTKKALLMGAHLGGAKSIIDFVKSGKDYKDAYGTSIQKYYKAGKESKMGIIKLQD